MKPVVWALLILIASLTMLVVCVIVSHAQTAIIGPDGRITYLYSYGAGLPTTVIPPTGGPIHLVPMTPPSTYVPSPVYVPPVYTTPAPMPSFSPPSFGSPPAYEGF